ncbi:MAG: hypothetical protein AAF533_04535 [Acidobacteriota bacterium]
MSIKKSLAPALITALALTFGLDALAQDQRASLAERIELPEHARVRFEQLAKALESQQWPASTELHAAPKIDRDLHPVLTALPAPSRAVTERRFDDEPWGSGHWSWRDVTRKAHSPRLEGALDLSITLAPDARAAHAALIADLSESQLPIDAVVNMLGGARGPEDLGDLAWLVDSRDGNSRQVVFLRSNLVVRLRSSGNMVEPALAIAREIDGDIKAQEAMDRKTLLSRRPRVQLEAPGREEGVLNYSVKSDVDSPILAERVVIDGQGFPAGGGKIRVPGGDYERVDLIAITAELLAGTGSLP